MQALPKVFLSYAGEDHPWVKRFADEFALQIGENIKIHDYNHGDHLEFGEIGKWIDAHINDASAVVCFISEHYRQKPYTIEELKKTLTEVRRRRLFFVPVMLDNRAKVWWAELRPQGELSALPVDYAFRNFTDERGKPVRITGDESVLMQIGDLAREIRKVLVPPPAPHRARALPS